MGVAISVENISKRYHLGTIGSGTFSDDLKSWWARQRGKPDPLARIGERDHGNRTGNILWALRDISFEVQQGEALGIIGRNGAGKSTLLKILSQVTAPTSGVVKVKGRIASLLEVGTGFHAELTGRENIYLNGAINGMSRGEIDHKFAEIVEFSGVEQYIDTPVKRYSSGMYVRLAFAVAAHLDPEILIVDEVLAVGDLEFQKKCLGKMGDVAHEGRTVLFVSHNMAAIQSLCQNGLFLQKGSVQFRGTQTETISHYIENLKDANISLSDTSHRPGNGQVRIVGAFLRDMDKKLISAVQSGKAFDICLCYKTGKNYISGRARIGISVINQQGVKVFNHSSVIQNIEFEKLAEEGKFVCHIHRLPLSPAVYRVGFSIKVDGEYADFVEYGLDLTVIQGDFYRTGFFPTGDGSICLVDADWKLERDE